MQDRTEYYNEMVEKLVNLGFKRDLIKESKINEQQAAAVYQTLQRSQPTISLKHSWQLYALSGDVALYSQLDYISTIFAHYAVLSDNLDALEWVKKHYPKYLTALDSKKSTIAHYAAACANNPNSMEWMSKHCPALLTQVNADRKNIAHWAAEFGKLDILEWIRNYNPRLLLEVCKIGGTIASYAAAYGKLDILEWISKYYPELLTQIDANKRNIAHHAAEFGKLDILKWISKYYPGLLTQVDVYEGNTAHCAAQCGKLEILEWIRNYDSQLLVEVSRISGTIAHSAAQFGQTDILEWISKHYPILITNTYDGLMTIARCAIAYDQLKVLSWMNENYPALLTEQGHNKLTISLAKAKTFNAILWINEHRPELLTQPDKDGLTLAQRITLSHNPARLNEVLKLLDNPRTFEVPKTHPTALKGLQQALGTNYFLTSMTYNGEQLLDQTLLQQVTHQLARNQAILDTIPTFCFWVSGHFQDNSPLTLLPQEILEIIFHHLLPPGVSFKAMNSLFNKALPYAECIIHHKNFIIDSIDQELATLKTPVSSFNKVVCLLNPIKQMGELELHTLKEVVSQEAESFSEFKSNIKAWQQSIQRNHNNIHNFFGQKRDLMVKITNIMNLNTL